MHEQAFCDYYEHLQVSPNADLETIERVFRLLAKKYHTDNKSTGNLEKFEYIKKAYKVLSNPEKRAGYDANYEGAKNSQWKDISRAYAASGFEPDRHIRRTILSILYTQRRQSLSSAGVGIVQLENLMEWPGETLDFHVWYLKEKDLIQRTDTGGFEITARGVDTIETDGMALRKDRLLPKASKPSDDSEDTYLIEATNQGAKSGRWPERLRIDVE